MCLAKIYSLRNARPGRGAVHIHEMVSILKKFAETQHMVVHMVVHSPEMRFFLPWLKLEGQVGCGP